MWVEAREETAGNEPTERADSTLFVQLYPPLRRFAAAVRPAGVDPDDLVQEALAAPSPSDRSVSVTIPAPTSGAPSCGSHRTIDGRSAAATRAFTRSSVPGVGADVYPSDLDDLRRLRPFDRAVLYLSIVERWSAREIADELRSTEQAVRARSSRALRKLLAELTDEHLEITDA